MLTRRFGFLMPRAEPAPEASAQIEREGYAVVPGAFEAEEVAALAAEIRSIFDARPADLRLPRSPAQNDAFRYEMLNRSPLCQRAIGHRAILDVIEPLLGEDCHVIANTAWRNPPDPEEGPKGGPWHIDAGPHVPRPEGVPWDDRIPYPVFAIGVHIYLEACPLDCGPTGVIPGSHRSGRLAPFDSLFDPELKCDGVGVEPLLAEAGDVALFASDVWHRRMPTGPGDRGRFFLQAHYGRRDLAQRLRTTDRAHQLSPEAIERATDERGKTVIGLHDPFFYDG